MEKNIFFIINFFPNKNVFHCQFYLLYTSIGKTIYFDKIIPYLKGTTFFQYNIDFEGTTYNKNVTYFKGGVTYFKGKVLCSITALVILITKYCRKIWFLFKLNHSQLMKTV